MARQITFNSNNVSFDLVRRGSSPTCGIENRHNMAASGIIETINLHTLFDVSFTARFTKQYYYDLVAWFSYVSQGNAFSVSFDTTLVGNTTLDAAAAAAQKTIPLTATGAFTAGEFCLIRTVAGLTYEVVEIASVSAGVSVTAVDNLKFTYASGDSFRHVDYHPALLLVNEKEFAPFLTGAVDTTANYYEFNFKCREDFS
ncbi:MAG: hypothetical protein GY841_12430 [FCB group bacterium]|nr:hypothetical protein [FCB group bacterium]